MSSDSQGHGLAPPRRIVIMGVSGCGKSTLGRALGERLGVAYIDGDDHHPQASIDKMARGEPLTDADRHGWLDTLAHLIGDRRRADQSLLLGCSALKRAYRAQLGQHDSDLMFLFLNGCYELTLARMQQRAHFFSPDMLRSQFDALEAPHEHDAIVVDIDRPFDQVVATCVAAVRRETG